MDDTQRAHKQELAKLGRAFREARERSGLSEHEVADAVRCISLAGVRAIEAGERPSFNYAQIVRLSRVLGVEPTAIIVRAQKASPRSDRGHGNSIRSGEQHARDASRWLRRVPTGARTDDRRGA